MKKSIKITLFGCGSLILILGIGVIGFVAYVLGGDASGTPQSVRYHNKSELYKITNIQFPDVILVDSSFYDSFSFREVSENFVLANPNEKTRLIDEVEKKMQIDSIYWERTDSSYIYYILPEEPIDRPNGTGWRKTENGEKDWDGDFIRMIIPLTNDTITLQYGWGR